MSCVVERKFNSGFILTKKGRKKAKAYLLSVGIDLDKSPKLIWPDDAIRAYRNHYMEQWQFIYKSDIIKLKIKEQKDNLWMKREYKVTRKVPLYVWVFYCPGIRTAFIDTFYIP